MAKLEAFPTYFEFRIFRQSYHRDFRRNVTMLAMSTGVRIFSKPSGISDFSDSRNSSIEARARLVKVPRSFMISIRLSLSRTLSPTMVLPSCVRTLILRYLGSTALLGSKIADNHASFCQTDNACRLGPTEGKTPLASVLS